MKQQEEVLWVLQDIAYREFSAKLLPGVTNIIGVRLPALRKLAKQYARNDWRKYLQLAKDEYFEETMLQGMVIGYARMTLEERFEAIEKFVPKITNWSVCDSFCNGLKFTEKHPDEVWTFLQPFFSAKEPFAVRFAVVMSLNYFIRADGDRLEEVFAKLAEVQHENYYVRMALGWAFSKAYIANRHQTLPWLEETRLHQVVLMKAIQKIIESNQVSLAEKEFFREKRRGLSDKIQGKL